jgi:hypothetical protein
MAIVAFFVRRLMLLTDFCFRERVRANNHSPDDGATCGARAGLDARQSELRLIRRQMFKYAFAWRNKGN